MHVINFVEGVIKSSYFSRNSLVRTKLYIFFKKYFVQFIYKTHNFLKLKYQNTYRSKLNLYIILVIIKRYVKSDNFSYLGTLMIDVVARDD